MDPRKCKNHPDLFCYVCGLYILPRNRRKINVEVKDAFLKRFGLEMNNMEVWAPNSVCSKCKIALVRSVTGICNMMIFV